MSDPNLRPDFANYQDSGWRAGLFRVVAIASLSLGFAAGLVAVVQAFGGPDLAYTFWLAFPAGVMAVITTDRLAEPSRRIGRGGAVRLGELVLLLVIVRLVVWVVRGFPSVEELGEWLVSPGRFFGPEYAAVAFITGAAWFIAMLAANDFYELRIQADEFAAHESRGLGEAASYLRVLRAVDRAEVLKGFAVRWLGLGMLVVLCVATLRVGILPNETQALKFVLRDADLPLPILGGVLLYFLAGLLLLSHGRLAVLRGRWFNQGVTVAPALIRRWHVSTLVAVLTIAVGALLLPLGTTSGLAAVLIEILAFLWRCLLLIMGLFQALIALLGLLFRNEAAVSETPLAERAPLAQAIPSQREAVLQLPPWLGGAVLWLVILLLGAYLLYRFLSASGFSETAPGRFWLRLRYWWRARRAALGLVLEARTRALRKRIRRGRRPPARPFVVSEGKAMTPRERVRAYYLQTVREAAERGVKRRQDQTPLEYVSDVEANWPEAGEDLEALTGAFVVARYSPEDVDAEQVSKVEALRRRVVQALKRGAHS